MSTEDNTPTVASMTEYAAQLQKLNINDLQRHGQWQMAQVSLAVTVLTVTVDEYKRRGIKLSPGLKALLLTLKRLVAGAAHQSIVLPASALNLQAHMAELAGEVLQAPKATFDKPLAIEPGFVPEKKNKGTVVDFRSKKFMVRP